MYPDHLKADMAINKTARKGILLTLSIIERNFEFKRLLGHRRC